jgi:hypothetical protein
MPRCVSDKSGTAAGKNRLPNTSLDGTSQKVVKQTETSLYKVRHTSDVATAQNSRHNLL